MSLGCLDVLNCGAGHLTFRFDGQKPDEAEKAKKVIGDMLGRGYMIFVKVDGQHRLAAIVASGVPLMVMVVYNVKPLAQAFMDSGPKRTVAERQKFGFGLDVDADDTSIANAMISRGRGADVNDTELNAFLQDYLEAIRFARSAYPKRWGNSYSALYAVLARAYYHVEGARVIRFCVVMNLQPYEVGEQAAAKWAKEIASHQGKLAPHEVFDRTQRALIAFLDGESKGVIKPESSNRFPLPGEDESEAYRPKVPVAPKAAAHHHSSNGVNRVVAQGLLPATAK